MTKGDYYTKENIKRILEDGSLDINPRPHYLDGEKAHTLSINHVCNTYDLDKGETPLITLRPIALKSSIGEILWIYRDKDNNVFNLERKYNIHWWRDWVINPFHYDESGKLKEGKNPYNGYYYDKNCSKINIGIKSNSVNSKTDFDGENILDSKTGNVLTKDANIGSTYGEIVRRNNLIEKLIDDLKTNPDGRRHIVNLWQYDDLNEEHGLPPCAYETLWSVRHKDNNNYLDMALIQRSSDYMTAGCINQMQYVSLLYLIAKETHMKPGRFTWFVNNMQIYDRHIDAAKEILNRDSVECNPKLRIDDVDLKDIMPDNFHIDDYPKDEIKKKNKQLKLEIGI